jgi:hypothetical protein
MSFGNLFKNVSARYSKPLGIKMLIFLFSSPLKHFEKEAKGVKSFAKEYVINMHIHLQPDGKSGLKPTSELDEPLIVRQTSETAIEEKMAVKKKITAVL